MIEVYDNLYVGNQEDYERRVRFQQSWRVVHACKEPYHRQALGYTGRGAPKTHPEYLIARRGDRLILNLVDADDPNYIPKEIINAALDFINEGLTNRIKTLVHCNQGESRSPAIAFLYLASHTDKIPKSSLEEAESAFREIYPNFNPGKGIHGFFAAYWGEYVDH